MRNERAQTTRCDAVRNMPTARTIDAAIAATLESAEEVLRGDGEGVAPRAVAEELFADLAVDQLLKLTGDS